MWSNLVDIECSMRTFFNHISVGCMKNSYYDKMNLFSSVTIQGVMEMVIVSKMKFSFL